MLSTIELKDNTIIVVLGASGDLAKKKTVRGPIDSLCCTAMADSAVLVSSTLWLGWWNFFTRAR